MVPQFEKMPMAYENPNPGLPIQTNFCTYPSIAIVFLRVTLGSRLTPRFSIPKRTGIGKNDRSQLEKSTTTNFRIQVGAFQELFQTCLLLKQY